MPHAHNAPHIYIYLYIVIYAVRTLRREDEADVERPESCVYRVCANAFGAEVGKQETQTRSDRGSLAFRACLFALWRGFYKDVAVTAGKTLSRKNKLQEGVLFRACARNWTKKNNNIKTHSTTSRCNQEGLVYQLTS